MATVLRDYLDRGREWSLTSFKDHFSTDSYGVRPTIPPKTFFRFPPSNFPTTLPPPLEGPNFENPFSIPTQLYNDALSPIIPITFALVYATVITSLNSVNQRRNQKPWAISRTTAFKFFVLAHNIFLSLYSLWTFVGMVNALRVSVSNPRQEGLAAMVDSLCKINGPRGHGAAVVFNERKNVWSSTNRNIRLGKDGLFPDSTDVGRIWNEGLAFYGWIFYLSKFYEVVDTLIIIAKGKKSSFLQTYHHAGAMLCMWAGIRYMSPPIWMFVTVNSFIHFVMYAFYTVTTLGIKVPKPLKQTLTTLQITQFVVGASYAFAHYFVKYQIPVSIPYAYHLGDAIKEAATSIKSDASSAVSVATATATADTAAWLKKLAFRAAGREGIAENVRNQYGETFGVDAVRAAADLVKREETRYRDDFQWVDCLDTSGQSFAIYLNILYLLPLTWLFLQFFITAYSKRVEERRRSSVGQRAYMAGQSANDARKGVGRRLSEAFEDYQGANGETADIDPEQIRRDMRGLAKKAEQKGKNAIDAGSEKAKDISKAASERGKNISNNIAEKTKSAAQAVNEKGQNIAKSASENCKNTSNTLAEKGKGTVQNASEKAQSASKSVSDNTKSASNTVAEKSKGTAQVASQKAGHAYEKVAEKGSNLAQSVSDTSKTVSDNVSETVSNLSKSVTEESNSASVSENLSSSTQSVTNQVQEMFEQLKAEAEAGAKKTQKAFNENVMSKETQEELESKAWNVVQSPKKSAKKVGNQVASKAADTGEKVKKEAEQTGSKAKSKSEENIEKGKQQAKDTKKEVTKKADGVKDNVGDKKSDTKAEQADKSKNASPKKPSKPTPAPAPTKPTEEDESTVQEGKSFAEAATEGVPKEVMGEVVNVDEADEVFNQEDDVEGA